MQINFGFTHTQKFMQKDYTRPTSRDQYYRYRPNPETKRTT